MGDAMVVESSGPVMEVMGEDEEEEEDSDDENLEDMVSILQGQIWGEGEAVWTVLLFLYEE